MIIKHSRSILINQRVAKWSVKGKPTPPYPHNNYSLGDKRYSSNKTLAIPHISNTSNSTYSKRFGFPKLTETARNLPKFAETRRLFRCPEFRRRVVSEYAPWKYTMCFIENNCCHFAGMINALKLNKNELLL